MFGRFSGVRTLSLTAAVQRGSPAGELFCRSGQPAPDGLTKSRAVWGGLTEPAGRRVQRRERKPTHAVCQRPFAGGPRAGVSDRSGTEKLEGEVRLVREAV